MSKKLPKGGEFRDDFFYPFYGHRAKLFFRLLLLFLLPPPPEPFHLTSGINQLLLTGKEGMTSGTDFNLNLWFRRPGSHGMATGTGDDTFPIFGMDPFLHRISLFFRHRF
jgi:hypothetical protein